jgi:ParB-like chromosome segregation protein Spo0J
VTTVLLDLKPSQIKPHKANVRRDVGNVDELAASIKEKGLLEPLIVAPDDETARTPTPSARWWTASSS